MAIFEKKLTKRKLQERARNNWPLWRLVFSGINYNAVFYQMTPNQIEEANAALDIKIKQEEKAVKRK